MTTFNDLLIGAGLDPKQVILVRHSGTRKNGLTPFDLWRSNDGCFEQYQSTQKAGRRIFQDADCWASFVSEPDNATVFVGLYQAELDVSGVVDWLCPLSGTLPGQDTGQEYDLFALRSMSELSAYRGKLRIDWGASERSWVQYARNDKQIAGGLDIPVQSSIEGKVIWKKQRSLERNAALRKGALAANIQRHHGKYNCEACEFTNPDKAMFDVHHVNPLETGERETSVCDLLVLCPTCHRRAHRSENRLIPYDLSQLKQWVSTGRT